MDDEFLNQVGAVGNAGDEGCARNGDRGARPAIHQEQNERKTKIKLVFDRERPRMGKRGAAVQSNVLDRQEKFPERLRHFGILAPRRQQKVNRQDREVGWHDSQGAPGEETTEINALIARKRGEELAADQITAEDKEKIDTDPAETIHAAG